jgi:predicted DNA-binding protein (UPF0251 family)/predicted Fe-Mo cluster-binding NifX family protein
MYPQQKITLQNVNKSTCFISANDVTNKVTMSIDEYETIRLIDYKNLTQEECAAQMDVARTTITAMYTSARKKIAQSIVESRILEIDGGNYIECQGRYCKFSQKSKTQAIQQETLTPDLNDDSIDDKLFTMKLAVPCENEIIFQRFGITDAFNIYTIKDSQIIKTEHLKVGNAEHKALVDFLIAHKIDSLLCGGIGERAKKYLLDAEIVIYSGVSGNADIKVQQLLESQLDYFLDFPTRQITD